MHFDVVKWLPLAFQLFDDSQSAVSQNHHLIVQEDSTSCSTLPTQIIFSKIASSLERSSGSVENEVRS